VKSQNYDIRKKLIYQFAITPAALLTPITAGGSSFRTIPQTGCYKREGLEPNIEMVIDEF